MEQTLLIVAYLFSVVIAAGVVTAVVNAIGRYRMNKGIYKCNTSGRLCPLPSSECHNPAHQSFPANPEGMLVEEHKMWFILAPVWPLWIPVGIACFIGYLLSYKIVPVVYNATVKVFTYIFKEVADPRSNVKES